MYTDIMIDIETMATKSNAAIVSIAALRFNMATGETGEGLYMNVDAETCHQIGLRIDDNTVIWWLKQTPEAMLALFDPPQIPITDALIKLAAFVVETGDQPKVWGNSARFDLGILEDAYEAAKLPLPWKYWQERCLRTLDSLAPEIRKSHQYTGTKHNSLSDCHNQVAYATKIWKKFNL